MDYDYFEGREPDPVAEHRRRVLLQKVVRRNLRDALNIFDIPTTQFIRLYRMPQHMALRLVAVPRPFMQVRTSPLRVPEYLRILLAVNFYAHGCYQKPTGLIAELSVAQSTVSTILTEMHAVFNHPGVLRRFIHFPQNRAERARTIARNEVLGLPRVSGFLDGTIVPIKPPRYALHREVFYCRKGYTALNVQILCDKDLYIMNVNAQYPGSMTDQTIWLQSALKNAVINAYREDRCWVLGDSGYPEEPWLHTPIPHAPEGSPEYYYTKVHCHCRNAVERCIGLLKAWWRCLKRERTLMYDPTKAGLIVNACCVLHNFCLLGGMPVNGRDFGCDSLNNGLDDDEEDEDNQNDDEDRLAIEERQFLIDFVNIRRVHLGH